MKEEGELFEVGPGGVERRMREGDGDEYDWSTWYANMKFS
jgi:hypothetical protein